VKVGGKAFGGRIKFVGFGDYENYCKNAHL
jgi:hypothetical protein